MLQTIELPRRLNELPIPPQTRLAITAATQRIEAFQDCWHNHKIEQFVAADYELVYQTLAWIRDTQPLLGNRFLEWGCGFAVVTSLATKLGFDAIGIEAEADLFRPGRDTVEDWFEATETRPELVTGNFLPADSERMADDPTLPSLGHNVPCAYETLGLELDDFAIVYSYPWPGENGFHEDVFERHARQGAIHVQFAGPNEMRVWRKVGAGRKA